MVKAAAFAEAAAVVVVVVFRVLGCLSLPPLVEVAAAVVWAVVVRTRSKGRGYGQGHFSPLVVTSSLEMTTFESLCKVLILPKTCQIVK